MEPSNQAGILNGEKHFNLNMTIARTPKQCYKNRKSAFRTSINMGITSSPHHHPDYLSGHPAAASLYRHGCYHGSCHMYDYGHVHPAYPPSSSSRDTAMHHPYRSPPHRNYCLSLQRGHHSIGDHGKRDQSLPYNSSNNLNQEVNVDQHSLQHSLSNELQPPTSCTRIKLHAPKSNEHGIFYYALFSGWSFPIYPPLFLFPGKALAWGLSRFKKEGLSNAWGPENYPDFMHYVGTAQVLLENVTKIEMPSCGKISSKEKKYFSDVTFFEPVDMDSIVSTGYVRGKDCLFNECINTMKSFQDFMSSSGSIYEANAKCPGSSQSDVEFKHPVFLSGKAQNRKFIQIEKNFSI